MLHYPILSIILPVYNGEAFIKRTIQSVIDQELQDWELIIINDGSKDQSETIISDFCTFDTRIITISQENKGLSAARNVGYHKATGKYIVFLDADDYVEPNYYKKLVVSTERYGADFVISSYIRDFVQSDAQIKSKLVCFKEQFLEKYNQIQQCCSKIYFYNVYIHVWNKIYRHDFLLKHGIVFDETKRYAEDVPYNIAVLEKAKNILFVDVPGYHYVCHKAERLTGKWNKSLLIDNCKVYQKIVAYEQDYLGMKQSEVAAGMYLRSCFLTVEKMINMKMSYKDIKENIKQLFNMPVLSEVLRISYKKCKSKEFLIYKCILKLKIPFLFYISVVLRRALKYMIGR
mgnify:CR=1 FL=1